jgi:hypothetical protein
VGWRRRCISNVLCRTTALRYGGSTDIPKERAAGFHTLCAQGFYWAATLKLLTSLECVRWNIWEAFSHSAPLGSRYIIILSAGMR